MDNDWYNDGTGYKIYKVDEINFSSIKSRINFFSQSQQRQRENHDYYVPHNNSFRRQTFNEPKRINYPNKQPDTIIVTQVLKNNHNDEDSRYRYLNGNGYNHFYDYHDGFVEEDVDDYEEDDDDDDDDDFDAMERKYLRKQSNLNKKNQSSSTQTVTNSTGQSRKSSNNNSIEQNSVDARNSKKVSQILRKFSTDLKNSGETSPNKKSNHSAALPSSQLGLPLATSPQKQVFGSINRKNLQRKGSTPDEHTLSNVNKTYRNSTIDITSNNMLRPSLTNVNDDFIASFQTPSNRTLSKTQINNRSNKALNTQFDENDATISVKTRNKINLNELRKNVVSSTSTITVPINSISKTPSLATVALTHQKDDPSTINLILKFGEPVEIRNNSTSELMLNKNLTTETGISSSQATPSSPPIISKSLILLPSQMKRKDANQPSKLIENILNNNEESSNDEEIINKNNSYDNNQEIFKKENTKIEEIESVEEDKNNQLSNNDNKLDQKSNYDLKNADNVTTYESEDTLINNLFQPILSAFDDDAFDFNNQPATQTEIKTTDKEKTENQAVLSSLNSKIDKTRSASTHSLMSTLLIDKIHNYSTDGSIRTHSSLINVDKNNNNIVNNNDLTDNDAISIFSSNNNLNDSVVIIDNKKEVLGKPSTNSEADEIKNVENNINVDENVKTYEPNRAEISTKKSRKYSLLLDKILLNDKFQNNNVHDHYYVHSENANSILNSRKPDSTSKHGSNKYSNNQIEEEQYENVNTPRLNIPDITTQFSTNSNSRSKRLSKISRNSDIANDKSKSNSYRIENIVRTKSDDTYLDENRFTSYNITSPKSEKQKENKKGKKNKTNKESTGPILSLKRFIKKDKVIEEETEYEKEKEKELKSSESHKIRNNLKKNCKIS